MLLTSLPFTSASSVGLRVLRLCRSPSREELQTTTLFCLSLRIDRKALALHAYALEAKMQTSQPTRSGRPPRKLDQEGRLHSQDQLQVPSQRKHGTALSALSARDLGIVTAR